MLNAITQSLPVAAPRTERPVSTPLVARENPGNREVRNAADTLRDGPGALGAAMKLAMARQSAEPDILRMRGHGEERRANGDVVTVEGNSRTLRRPDGSSQRTDLAPGQTRLTETDPDGSSRTYYGNDQGVLTVEYRDPDGNLTGTEDYSQEDPRGPYQQGPG